MADADIVDAEVIEDAPRANVAAMAVRDTPGALVRPAASVAEIEQAFRDYSTLCERLLDNGDYQDISGKKFRKRSAWRKLAVAFGVTFHIADRIIHRDGPSVVSAEFVVRASAPNGRYADGWGSCDIYERCCPNPCPKKSWNKHTCCPTDCLGSTHFSHANHDVPATAETRAKNRAAADLFGMGEVSAEEVTGTDGKGAPEPGPLVATGPVPDCPECGRPTVVNDKRSKDTQPTHHCQAGCKSKDGKYPLGVWHEPGDAPADDGEEHRRVLDAIRDTLTRVPDDQKPDEQTLWPYAEKSVGNAQAALAKLQSLLPADPLPWDAKEQQARTEAQAKWDRALAAIPDGDLKYKLLAGYGEAHGDLPLSELSTDDMQRWASLAHGEQVKARQRDEKAAAQQQQIADAEQAAGVTS